jgi:hypothetical protein
MISTHSGDPRLLCVSGLLEYDRVKTSLIRCLSVARQDEWLLMGVASSADSSKDTKT